MEDQMCSPEKYWMKNSWNKKIFLLNEKKKNQKKTYDKNISHWIQTYFDRIKIYFDIIKKSDIMKNYFIEYEFILVE